MTLFDFKQRFGGKKLITFKSEANIQIEFFKVEKNGEEKLFSVYQFTNITDIK